VKLSVELPDRDMKGEHVLEEGNQAAASSPVPATPISSLSDDDGSPDIEVIDVPDDDTDAVLGDGEPEVSIIGESRNALQDPTLDFPYNDGEPLIETVSRLANYISGRKLSPLPHTHSSSPPPGLFFPFLFSLGTVVDS